MRLPQHLAIIMDGNGRWAQSKGLPRIAGHQQGVETVRKIVTYCADLGIRYLTLYAFSSENWKRPESEVQALMSLLGHYLANEIALLHNNSVRFQVIGELTKLPYEIKSSLQDSVAATAGNKGMTLTLALSYGSRNEIVRGVQQLCADVQAGSVNAARIDEDIISSYLDTAAMPDPDLLIRTSGEMRISNFLLWQLAYTELYFSSCFWPEFDSGQLQQALEDYARRCRRFGAVHQVSVTEVLPEGEIEEI
jgi:undecaprenyl diphosphate synthase